MSDHPAVAWRRLAERVAFHMGALAHDLAILEAEGSAGPLPRDVFGPFERVPVVTHRCPAPCDGGMCGCEEADGGVFPLQLPPEPKVCLSRECDCL